MVRAFGLVSLCLLVFVGCGSSGSGSGGNPVADCNNFINNHYCPKIVSCGYYPSQSGCVAAAQSGLSCSTVKSESGTLGACESEFDSLTCSELNYDLYVTGTLPPDCQGVFLQ
jgi:hypothetical protein